MKKMRKWSTFCEKDEEIRKFLEINVYCSRSQQMFVELLHFTRVVYGTSYDLRESWNPRSYHFGLTFMNVDVSGSVTASAKYMCRTSAGHLKALRDRELVT